MLITMNKIKDMRLHGPHKSVTLHGSHTLQVTLEKHQLHKLLLIGPLVNCNKVFKACVRSVLLYGSET